MTANDTNDDDREKDTDAGSLERRLGEVIKQAKIVLDTLEGERHRLERVEEFEAGILKLINENVRRN